MQLSEVGVLQVEERASADKSTFGVFSKQELWRL